MFQFKKGDRVVSFLKHPAHHGGICGTVLDKKADADRTWVRFDFLPQEYGGGPDTNCTTLNTVLILEHVFNSPLYKALS